MTVVNKTPYPDLSKIYCITRSCRYFCTVAEVTISIFVVSKNSDTVGFISLQTSYCVICGISFNRYCDIIFVKYSLLWKALINYFVSSYLFSWLTRMHSAPRDLEGVHLNAVKFDVCNQWWRCWKYKICLIRKKHSTRENFNSCSMLLIIISLATSPRICYKVNLTNDISQFLQYIFLREGLLYEKDDGARRKIWKESLRGARILYGGCIFFFHPQEDPILKQHINSS